MMTSWSRLLLHQRTTRNLHWILDTQRDISIPNTSVLLSIMDHHLGKIDSFLCNAGAQEVTETLLQSQLRLIKIKFKTWRDLRQSPLCLAVVAYSLSISTSIPPLINMVPRNSNSSSPPPQLEIPGFKQGLGENSIYKACQLPLSKTHQWVDGTVEVVMIS